GTSSIGMLELVDTNVTLSDIFFQNTMEFDIGGVGVYDNLTLSGIGGILDLGSGGTLDIWAVDGFTLSAGTYRIINANSVTGTFGTLNYNGAAANGEYD